MAGPRESAPSPSPVVGGSSRGNRPSTCTAPFVPNIIDFPKCAQAQCTFCRGYISGNSQWLSPHLTERGSGHQRLWTSPTRSGRITLAHIQEKGLRSRFGFPTINVVLCPRCFKKWPSLIPDFAVLASFPPMAICCSGK